MYIKGNITIKIIIQNAFDKYIRNIKQLNKLNSIQTHDIHYNTKLE